MNSSSVLTAHAVRRSGAVLVMSFMAVAGLSLTSCSKQTDVHAADTGPHDAVVEADMDANNFKVEHPDQFPVAEAGS